MLREAIADWRWRHLLPECGRNQAARSGRDRPGPGGAENAPAESVLDESRQVSAVIEVRVGQDDGVEIGRLERHVLPIALAELFQALEEAAIDQDLHVTCVEQILRSGHGAGRTEKCQRHASSKESHLSARVPEQHRFVAVELATAYASDQPCHGLRRVSAVEEHASVRAASTSASFDSGDATPYPPPTNRSSIRRVPLRARRRSFLRAEPMPARIAADVGFEIAPTTRRRSRR